MKHCAADILNILDDGARNFVFPMLDNGYVYLAATRLSLFRSPDDWAVVFEIFGFSPRAGVPDLLIATLGSNLVRAKEANDYVSPEAYTNCLKSHRYDEQVYFYPINNDEWIDPDDSELVHPGATSLSLRGRTIPVPSDRDYVDAKVLLQNQPRPFVFEFCRALARSNRSDVLATPAERTASLAPEFECILTLDEWHHPDVVDPDALPSTTSAFRQFADVLVSGNASIYQPIEAGNTHWSNWPDGGTL